MTKNYKKPMSVLSLVISCLICFSFVSGCMPEDTGDNGRLKVISTVFPGYDFARQVFGDKADISMLIPPGGESHTFDPSPKDIVNIENCDLLICVGGESETWLDSVVSSSKKDINVLKMMQVVSEVFEEESVRSEEHSDRDQDGHGNHSHDHDHDHDHSHSHNHDHTDGESDEDSDEHVEYDEHVWTSPTNAISIISAVCNAACRLSPDDADYFLNGADDYTGKISELDGEFSAFFETVEDKTLIFGDRFPLLYFVRHYGLDYFAAFPGCTAQTEPSAATLTFLSDKIKSEEVGYIYYTELSNHVIADSLASATGVKTAIFYSCHNVTREDFEKGEGYLSLMRKNLETLKITMKTKGE